MSNTTNAVSSASSKTKLKTDLIRNTSTRSEKDHGRASYSAVVSSKEILKINKPLFGICLGHQVIALANGISTYKMHNGHRGINHPVLNLLTGKGEVTSQNHGFAINKEEAESNPDIKVTHLHLNDDTIAGISIKNKNCFSVQYHPEASPGPHDSNYLFDQFIELIKSNINE